MKSELRVGIGYDIHALTAGRKLVLGGVTIPAELGLDGWSDADCLTHAVIDALLGAAALGDIGVHFPTGEASYEGISSLVLLETVVSKLAVAGWRVVNVDVTVVAERPKLVGHFPEMRQNLSAALGVEDGQVSLKASTAAELGPAGRDEAIEARAVALICGIEE